MKCPFCSEGGAKVDRRLVFASVCIGNAISCRNPQCRAFDPIVFGCQPRLSSKAHLFWKQYLESTGKAVSGNSSSSEKTKHEKR